MEARPSLALEGIRVVDWTHHQIGPVAGVVLADLGAEVIKIEERTQGDYMRRQTKSRGQIQILANGMPPMWESCNRNKKGLAVDLKKPEGLEIVYGLVTKSDVFLHNYRQQVADRLGLGYETLHQMNPRVIYGVASGFGPNGPKSHLGGYDPLGHAGSGFMYGVGEPDAPPTHIPAGLGDQCTGTVLAMGVMAALLARERTGVGQKVDASLLGSMVWLQNGSISSTLAVGKPIPRQFRARAPNPLWNHYRCQDDRWIMLACRESDRHWGPFCQALGSPEVLAESRFSTEAQREQHCAALVAILDQIFASRARAEWIERFESVGGIIYYPVQQYTEVIEDPQVMANGYLQYVNHPELGRVKMMGFPVLLSSTPATVRARAPHLGEHTDDILTGLLGYSEKQVADLRRKEVVGGDS